MDLLTHIFLPLTALYVLRKFNPPHHFLLALFAVLPDFDKLIGIPGLLHSLITLVPLVFVVFLLEKLARRSSMYAGIAAFFVASHLFLDVLDGGPVPFFYPFIKTGVGLVFPIKIAFHSFSFSFLDSPVELVYAVPKASLTYELLSGFGVASLILFVMIYLRMGKQRE